MNIVTIWHAEDEHRKTVGISYTESDAEDLAKNQGEWGSDGYVCQRRAIMDGDNYYLLDKDCEIPLRLNVNIKKAKADLRKSGLAKLTSAERIALELESE